MTKDFPLDEVAAEAGRRIAAGAQVHQKWTCPHCRSRQTMETPDTFYRSGKCGACGVTSVIERCNYLMIVKGPGQARGEN